MAPARLALLALAGLGVLGAAAAGLGPLLPQGALGARTPEPLRPGLVVSSPRGIEIVLAGAGGPLLLPGTHPGDTAPALSPDGRRLALSRSSVGRGEILVVDLWSGVSTRLTTNPRAVDTAPAWSPDGRRLAWASGAPGALDLYAMDADGSGKRALVRGPGNDTGPAWSPDGRRLLYASTRETGSYDLWTVPAGGGEPQRLVAAPGHQRDPAWSPGGFRIAYSSTVAGNTDVWVASAAGGTPRRLTRGAAFDGRPAWSPDGQRLAFVSGRGGRAAVWSTTRAGTQPRPLADARLGAALDWGDALPGPAPLPGEPLPDLDQRAPAGLVVTTVGGRFRLGFASAVDNVGTGAAWVRGTREPGAATMRADQLVALPDGSIRTYRGVGELRYTPHPPHYHWHYQPFERYELRRPSDFALLERDRKSGFCLADHYGHAASRVGGSRPARFLGDCGKGRPELRGVDQGSSVGFTDRYPAFFHGQDLDLTGVPAGVYVVVHRANPERLLHELRYDNNAASVRIRLARAAPGSVPTVTLLQVCEGSERCPPG
jgi:WD40 repeat protein/lysyl oxidase